MPMPSKAEVLVIGGGATGTGIARDLAMRGVDIVLVEAGDFATGTTGANHGMLHSGARYALTDPISAKECAAESKILKHIAHFCIEDTGGLFVLAKDDNEGYADEFLNACRLANIDTHEIDVDKALTLEPGLDSNIRAVVEVPDASIDPFFLTLGNVEAARFYGATVLNHSPVCGIRSSGSRFEVTINSGKKSILADVVVNATGAWAGRTAAMLGIDVPICMDKGTMVVFNGRLVNRLINRMRPPSDGDILVPHRTSTILGTTSSPGSLGEVASYSEVESLINEAAAIFPNIRTARAIRSYTGIRPLLNCKEMGRSITRSFQVIDHAYDGVDGMLSIIGGKLTTFRLMAEKASDVIMKKLGRTARCSTANEEIILSDDEASDIFDVEAMRYRQGRKINNLSLDMACGCEAVSSGELFIQASSPDVVNMDDLMRRTRAGMGYCQAGLCVLNMASAMGVGVSELRNYMSERWKGIEPILYGEQLRQEAFKAHLMRVYGIDHTEPPQ